MTPFFCYDELELYYVSAFMWCCACLHVFDKWDGLGPLLGHYWSLWKGMFDSFLNSCEF
jgi:hypothetical protein